MVRGKIIILECSQCHRKFRNTTRGGALTLLRKHLLKNHRAWLGRRIKAGMRKAKKASGNPDIFHAILAGIFPPATIPHIISEYKKLGSEEKQAVQTSIRVGASGLGPEGQLLASLVIKALDSISK